VNLDSIGEVERLQVHLADLKLGEPPYDPTRLASVDELWLTARGCIAGFRGVHVLDTHHLDYPGPRRHANGADRVVSIGFTSHHARIDQLFGTDRGGDAGENIVVASARGFGRADLAGGVAIMGNHAPVWLRDLAVAEPCVQFTRHVLQTDESDPSRLSDGLAQLGRGVRGFVCGLPHLRNPMVIRVGDEVLRSVSDA
jgi:hypothetical protein